MPNKGIFRGGTSGLVLAEPNKAAFPTEFRDKSRLCYYASLFNSIEINSTFYKVPRPVTFANWTLEVPEFFQFTIKLWRGITHAKEFNFNPDDVIQFMHAADQIGNRKGCLLIQFARTTAHHPQKLKELLQLIGKSSHGNKWCLAVELRHTAWYNQEIFDLLDESKTSLVLHDMPLSSSEKVNAGAPFIYLRFHGIKGDFRGSYSDEFLQQKALQVNKWLHEGKDVYAYFNNTIGDALENLKTLKKYVDSMPLI